MIPDLPFSSRNVSGANQPATSLSDLNLKPGQTVNARVVDVMPNGRAELVLGGQKIIISSELPMKPGMDISLTAVRGQNGIILKADGFQPGSATSPTAGSTWVAVDSKKSMLSFPLETNGVDSGKIFDTGKPSGTIPSSFLISRIFQGLSELGQTQEPLLNNILMGLSLKSGQRDDQFLPKILKDMGLSFENKLARGLGEAPDSKASDHLFQQEAGKDLKAAVLSLLHATEQGTKAETLKHIAQTLDNLGQLNAGTREAGGTQDGTRFLLPFPVWTENGFDFGQLLVEVGNGQSKGAEKKMVNISFLLNMTALGPLRADFSILEKTVAGRFLLENQDTCDYLEDLIPELRDRLSNIGYKTGKINCQVAEVDQIAPASLMASMERVLGDEQGLNIVV